jgi:predicted ArsR family transcriptional regulator
LAKILLEEVGETQGPDALQDVLRRAADRLAALYRDQIWGRELADRVAAWTELLDQRGVSVEVEKTETGYTLREYGCPYQNVAISVQNRAVCEMERQVMAQLFLSGVQLVQCVLDGHRGCQFTVADEVERTNESKN